MKLTNQQKQELSKLAKKYKLKLIMLFGSFSNGKNRTGSDFDISVLGENRAIIKKDIKLIEELSRIIRKDIDLSIINSADPLLKYQIAKNCVLLYGKKSDFINFKVRASLEYMDNKKFFDLEYNYILR